MKAAAHAHTTSKVEDVESAAIEAFAMEMHGGAGQRRGGRGMECTCKARATRSRLAHRAFDWYDREQVMHLLADARRDHESTCSTSTHAESGGNARRARDADSVRVMARAAGEQEMMWVRRD